MVLVVVPYYEYDVIYYIILGWWCVLFKSKERKKRKKGQADRRAEEAEEAEETETW